MTNLFDKINLFLIKLGDGKLWDRIQIDPRFLICNGHALNDPDSFIVSVNTPDHFGWSTACVP